MLFWSFYGVGDALRDFFTLSEREYEHFTVNGMFAGIALLCVFLCFATAYLLWQYDRSLHRDLIKAMKDSSNTEDTAKTLSDLGFDTRRVKRELRDRVGLSRYLVCVGEEKCTAPLQNAQTGQNLPENAQTAGDGANDSNGKETAHNAKIKSRGKGNPEYRYDFSSDRFYLPAEKTDAAEIRYLSHGEVTAGKLIFVTVGMFLAYLLLRIFLPDLLSLFDKFLGLIF